MLLMLVDSVESATHYNQQSFQRILLHDDKGSHSFNNRNSTRYNTRIMSSLSRQNSRSPIISSSSLRLTNSCRTFECNLKKDVLSIRNPSLYPTRIIRQSPISTIFFLYIWIIMFRSRDFSRSK